ncbi:hypothetical protein CALCODRAFT_544628 [Calocera cornea HHB12733]|uniref:Uncharacterized protein n=1 Tax=Calocera cornea HHB12733 TaxID=1353952 RepID=A0A165JIW9_9BASI|nr:hypothetical protein CALCODRAFT_544628 [Calocera cornea HHB12733]
MEGLRCAPARELAPRRPTVRQDTTPTTMFLLNCGRMACANILITDMTRKLLGQQHWSGEHLVIQNPPGFVDICPFSLVHNCQKPSDAELAARCALNSTVPVLSLLTMHFPIRDPTLITALGMILDDTIEAFVGYPTSGVPARADQLTTDTIRSASTEFWRGMSVNWRGIEFGWEDGASDYRKPRATVLYGERGAMHNGDDMSICANGNTPFIYDGMHTPVTSSGAYDK